MCVSISMGFLFHQLRRVYDNCQHRFLWPKRSSRFASWYLFMKELFAQKDEAKEEEEEENECKCQSWNHGEKMDSDKDSSHLDSHPASYGMYVVRTDVKFELYTKVKVQPKHPVNSGVCPESVRQPGTIATSKFTHLPHRSTMTKPVSTL